MQRIAVTLAFGLFLGAGPAQAHLAIEGLGDFANGALHPLLVPGHVMVIAAVALLAGRQLQGYETAVRATISFLAGVLLGLAAASAPRVAAIVTEDRLQVVLLSGAVVAGLAVALAVSVPRGIMLPLAGLTGLLVGADSGLVDRSWWVVAQTYAGTALTTTLAALFLACVAAEIHDARPHWMQVGVRVIGSWIAAIAVLILALLVSGPQVRPGNERVEAGGAVSATVLRLG